MDGRSGSEYWFALYKSSATPDGLAYTGRMVTRRRTVGGTVWVPTSTSAVFDTHVTASETRHAPLSTNTRAKCRQSVQATVTFTMHCLLSSKQRYQLRETHRGLRHIKAIMEGKTVSCIDKCAAIKSVNVFIPIKIQDTQLSEVLCEFHAVKCVTLLYLKNHQYAPNDWPSPEAIILTTLRKSCVR